MHVNTCTYLSHNVFVKFKNVSHLQNNMHEIYFWWTGIVTVATSRIDYESRQSINVTVRASDSGIPPKTTEQLFTIDIININDNLPIFSEPFYEAEINENATVRQNVITVSASDLDLPPYGAVKYVK